MAKEAVVDSKGRILIPASLRRALGLREGARVRLLLEGGKMVLTKPLELEKFISEIEGCVKEGSPIPEVDALELKRIGGSMIYVGLPEHEYVVEPVMAAIREGVVASFVTLVEVVNYFRHLPREELLKRVGTLRNLATLRLVPLDAEVFELALEKLASYAFKRVEVLDGHTALGR